MPLREQVGVMVINEITEIINLAFS